MAAWPPASAPFANSGQPTTLTRQWQLRCLAIPAVRPRADERHDLVDMRDVEDLWIIAMAANVAGASPQLVVSLSVFDEQGTLWSVAT